MKSVYCLCIVNLLLLTSDGDAGLVKRIISSIHDTGHKIRDDIHQALHFKEDPKKDTDVVTVADHKTNDDSKFVASSTAAYNNKEVNKEVTGFVMPKDEDDSKLIFESNPTTKATVNPTTKATVNPTTKATVNPTTEATVNFTSTTVKNGRENFAGGCSTGYERTVDGRCRPTF